MKFEILNRWNQTVIFGIDLPDAIAAMAYKTRLGWAVLQAIKTRANLTDANLTCANLTRANLTDANLTCANLTRADLTRADLTDANLTRADLTDADLTDANLTCANLTRADLTDANLTRADLTDADLTDANLTCANLTRADLTDADLTRARADFFLILLYAKKEAPALLSALTEGRVNGSIYTGRCSCLIGTIATARGIDPYQIEGELYPKSSRPAERLFLAIREGDTPENNPVSAIAASWTREFLILSAS